MAGSRVASSFSAAGQGRPTSWVASARTLGLTGKRSAKHPRCTTHCLCGRTGVSFRSGHNGQLLPNATVGIRLNSTDRQRHCRSRRHCRMERGDLEAKGSEASARILGRLGCLVLCLPADQCSVLVHRLWTSSPGRTGWERMRWSPRHHSDLHHWLTCHNSYSVAQRPEGLAC